MLSRDITALRQHFASGWDGALTIYDNQPSVKIPEKTVWCRFSVRAGASTHDAGSATNGIQEQQGRVWLQVFVPEQQGDYAGILEQQRFGNLFKNKRLDDNTIFCETPEYGTNPTLSGGYFMLTVSVFWRSLRRY